MNFESIIKCLALFESVVGIAFGDGATKNVIFYNLSPSVKQGDFITPDTKATSTKYDIKGVSEFEVAITDEYTDHLIFFLEDIKYKLKRIANEHSNS